MDRVAVFRDRLLEVADDGDPVAEGVEDVLLEPQRLASLGGKVLLDRVQQAGCARLASALRTLKASSRSQLKLW